MNDSGAIVNRVANSPLRSIDLEELFPKQERVVIDLKDNLYNGLILREKDFRSFIKDHNWAYYQDKYVAVTCTVDAIIPTWAYMLVASKLYPFARMVVYGDENTLVQHIWHQTINKLDREPLQDAKVVIKGCGNVPLPEFGFVAITQHLTPVVSSLMYGEPCSTVPVYKKSKK